MKFKHILLHCIIALILGSISVPLLAANLPQLVAARVTSAPVMDGKLDDPAWSNAPEVSGFALLDVSHGKPDCPTYVKALADDKALYLGFRCIEPMISSIVTKEEPRDSSVWLQEAIDIVISPTIDCKDCYHFMGNISGSQYDSKGYIFVTGAQMEDSKWNCDWQIKTSRGNKEWCAEVRIPFAGIGADLSKNSVLRANFSRSRLIGKEQDSTWAPNILRFFEPKNLGELIIPGADNSYCQIKFPQLASATTSFQNIPLSVFNHSNATIQPKLTYEFSGTQSFSGDLTLPVIPAGKEVSTKLKIKMPQVGNYMLRLNAVDRVSGKTLSSISREVVVTQPVVFDEALYALYQKKAVADLDMRVSSKGAKLEVSLLKDGSITPLAVKSFNPASNGSVKVGFDLAGMSKGAYQMRAVLVRNGKTFGESYSRKFPYSPDPKVGMNKDGYVLVDGKPFFPVGIYSLINKNCLGTTDEIMEEAKQAGFNTTVLYETRPAYLMPVLDMCERYGIKAFVYPTVPIGDRNGSETIETVHRDLDIRRNHPAILGWYVVDEPDGIGLAPVEAVRDLFQSIKEYDQDHPCAMVVTSPRPAGDYRSCTDIMWADTYPLPFESVTVFSDVIAGSVKNIEKDKPLWSVPQAFDWSVWRTGKVVGVHSPTPDEERCMTYLALVNGAKGVVFWTHTGSKYYIRDYPEHWACVKKIAGELRDLTPALLTQTINGKLSVAPKNDAIQTMLKKIDGKWYVIAVNSGNSATDVDFCIRGMSVASQLEVVFENRFLPFNKGKWRDHFKPLEVHVYSMDAQ